MFDQSESDVFKRLTTWFETFEPGFFRITNGTLKTRVWATILAEEPLLGQMLRIYVPEDFPASKPFLLVDKRFCLTLPHVEGNGKICLSTPSDPVDLLHPENCVLDLLRLFATEYLPHLNSKEWVTAQFRKESLSYWFRAAENAREQRDFGQPPRTAFSELPQIDGPTTGVVHAFFSGGFHRRNFGFNQIISSTPARAEEIQRRHQPFRGTLVKGHALFVPLPLDEPWTPTDWPSTLMGLDDLIERVSGKTGVVQRWIDEALANRPSDKRFPHPLSAIFIQGTVMYGVQVCLSAIPLIVDHTLKPFIITRIDPSWSLSRDQHPARFAFRQTRRILLLGCGALGAPVYELLARAGVGIVDASDNQLMASENITRHILGLSDVGSGKAVRMAERLRRDVPGTITNGRYETALDRVSISRPGMYDMVVDCTGDQSVRLMLTEKRHAHFGDVPILTVWLEVQGVAAHAVLTTSSDPWPMNDPVDRINIAGPQAQDMLVKLPACGEGFHLYGASDAAQAAAFAVERVLNILDGGPATSTIWSMVRSLEYFKSVGVPVGDASLPCNGDIFSLATHTRPFKFDEVATDAAAA